MLLGFCSYLLLLKHVHLKWYPVINHTSKILYHRYELHVHIHMLINEIMVLELSLLNIYHKTVKTKCTHVVCFFETSYAPDLIYVFSRLQYSIKLFCQKKQLLVVYVMNQKGTNSTKNTIKLSQSEGNICKIVIQFAVYLNLNNGTFIKLFSLENLTLPFKMTIWNICLNLFSFKNSDGI